MNEAVSAGSAVVLGKAAFGRVLAADRLRVFAAPRETLNVASRWQTA